MMSVTINRRLWALIVALLLAALATAALLSYVRGVERRAEAGATNVSVVVARETIPAGTTASSASSRGLLGRAAVPQRLVPEGAVTTLDQLKGKVAATTIHKGEQIVAGRFVEPAALSGVLPIPADRQALSLEVTVPNGVGGFIEPGNHISLIAKFSVTLPNGTKQPRAKYLVQDIPVLAVGERVVSVPGASAGSGKTGASSVAEQEDRVQLTLAVYPQDAEKITLAIFDGELEATLLPAGQKPVTTPGRTADNIFN